MQAFFDAALKAVQTVNAYLSDYILLFLLVGIGLFYTIRTRFVQVRCFGEGMKKVFGNLSLKGKKAYEFSGSRIGILEKMLEEI